MNKIFFNRIGYKGKIEDISKKVCEDFSLGKFKSNKLIAIGYEEFNFILETSKGKYVVKIFANFRDEKDCRRIVDINLKATKKGISVPELIKSKQGYFYSSKIGDTKIRLCTLEYIDGESLYNSKHKASADDIKSLARQASLINSLKIKPNFVYDQWAIPNFAKEFEKKSKYLQKSDLKKIKPLVEDFKKLDIKTLPHCFVHGDIISPNVLKDKNKKIWIIDFAVANYYPRIQELAVLACDIFFDKSDKNKSEENLKLALEEYQKNIKLTEKELKILPLYVEFAHAMHVLSANYQKVAEKNNSKENEYFLRIGRVGLGLEKEYLKPQ